MRKEFFKYMFSDIETVHPYGTILDEKNYLTTDYCQRVFRHIDGKVIQVKGNIYESGKFNNEISHIFLKLLIRSLKECHVSFPQKIVTMFKLNDYHNSKIQYDLYLKVMKYYMKLYSIYILEFDK